MRELINNNHLKMEADKDLPTLRDHFAGLAMQALIGDNRRSGSEMEFAEYAYEIADAMMKERAK